jgi:uncharacterized protein (TIGR02001 family)
MKRLIVAAALAVPGLAAAQLTGNASLVSDYRFRGISQTFEKPALQGGFDYAHASGLYVGNWNSNVSQGAGFPGGNLEMDFYGGWKKAFGDFGLDVGFIYYYYPGTNAGTGIAFSPANNISGTTHSGRVDNKEVYVGGTWRFLSLKYFHSLDDYFSAPGTKNSKYLDFGAAYDLGGGWGVNAHVGRLDFKNMSNADYTDWKLGVTKDIGGFVFGAAYIDTNAKGNCSAAEFYCFPNTNGTSFRNAGDSKIVLSVSKAF